MMKMNVTLALAGVSVPAGFSRQCGAWV